MKRLAFNDTRYQDHADQEDSDNSWSGDVARTDERFDEIPIVINDDDYLYRDENVDRFNAGKDYNQRQGQPKGVDPDTGPVNEFESDKSSDEIQEFFTGNFLDSFNNEENLVKKIR